MSTIQASTAVVKVDLHRVTSTVGPLSPHANLGDDVHFSVDHSSTVECSDRGTLVRNEVVVVSRLSMDLKAELNRLQFGVSDVLRWQRDGEQRITMHSVVLIYHWTSLAKNLNGAKRFDDYTVIDEHVYT